MLTKLAIFNSQKHAKVIIDFKDATAIQIIGENKIGKTTLIDTLNFLYIIDPQKMSFDNKKYTFKESVNHFFPTHNRSYLVFECYKRKAGGYFNILVKRKGAGDNVEYFKIDKAFDENDYLNQNGELKKFEEVYQNLSIENCIESFKDKSSLFQYVYNKDLNKNTFVWINKKVRRQGQTLENSLSKIYLFLLNASLIDDGALREALIIADNKQNESLGVFADKTKINTVEKLKREGQYIKKLNAIKDSFENFKFQVKTYEKKKTLVGELFYSLQHYLSEETKTLSHKITETQNLISNYNREKELIEPKQRTLTETIGGLRFEMKSLKNEIPGKRGRMNEIEDRIQDIDALLENISPVHNTIEKATIYLETQKNTFKKQYDEVAASLQSITQYQTTERETNVKIDRLTKEKEQLENQIDQYQNLLIHNISDDEQVRKFFNTIFSKEVTAKFTKDDLVQKVKSFSDILDINDGKVKGFDKLKLKDLDSIDILKEHLLAIEKDLSQQQDILATIKDRTGKENQKNKLESQIAEYENSIRKINNKKALETELKKLIIEWNDLQNQIEEKEKERTEIVKELSKVTDLIKENENAIRTFHGQIAKYKDWYTEFEFENLTPVENLIDKPIEEIRSELKREKNFLNGLYNQKKNLFEDLRNQTESLQADEQEFIKQIQEEILSIKDREKSLETLLEQTSNDFTRPVADFLQRYKEFKVFINSFNRTISQYKISDLKALRIVLKDNKSLISDLEKISKIIRVDQFQPDVFNQFFNNKEQQEYLEVLKEYNDTRSKPVEFKELFDVSLVAEDANNKSKYIDLRKGNESTGTIRMINLILFLLVIKFFKVEDRENKLVFFVDEDVIDTTNTAQLVKFCKENGFIIIFAAKHQIVGLEKYYFMKKSAELGNKVFADDRNVIYAEKKVSLEELEVQDS